MQTLKAQVNTTNNSNLHKFNNLGEEEMDQFLKNQNSLRTKQIV